MNTAAQELTIRCGFEFVYEASSPTPAILKIQPRLDPWQRKEKEQMTIFPYVSAQTFEDPHGNIVQRFTLPPGRTTVRHDIFIAVPVTTDDHWLIDQPVPVADVPPELLHYTLPSRYCDSDRLMNFATQQFGIFPEGLPRVQAICDWVNRNIQYRWGSGSTFTTASEVLAQGFGVCRDFAHLAVALSMFQCADALRHGLRAGCRLLRSGHTDGLPRLHAGLCGTPLVHVRRALQCAAHRAHQYRVRAGCGGWRVLDAVRACEPRVVQCVDLPDRSGGGKSRRPDRSVETPRWHAAAAFPAARGVTGV